MSNPNECHGVGCKEQPTAKVWVTVCGVSYPITMCQWCAAAREIDGARVEWMEDIADSVGMGDCFGEVK